jgi:hypothetical protein
VRFNRRLYGHLDLGVVGGVTVFSRVVADEGFALGDAAGATSGNT